MSVKKILVTGAKGQLGYDVVKRLKKDGYEVKGVDISDFDISDTKKTVAFIKKNKPNVVVHCSAYTAVDKAESEKELCYKVNTVGTKNIAVVCKEIDAAMCYISTDYVFNGQGNIPFETTDKTTPLGVYGQTKLDGEIIVQEILDKFFIIRISWVFGKNGNNFVKTMLRLSNERESLSVVADQIGSPTYTVDAADFIAYLVDKNQYGVYHFTNEGFCSWHDFAKEIFTQKNMPIDLKPISTAEYKTPAARPLNSRLSKRSVYDIGYKKIPSWQDALRCFLKN